jgi:hypothetical protein
MIVTNNVKSSVQSNEIDLVQQKNYRKVYNFSAYSLSVPSPVFSVLEKNKYYLLETADQKTLDSKYHRRPDLFCYDTYKDPGFYFVILFINDMFSLMDFVTDKIMVPTSDRILSVVSETEVQSFFADIKQTVQL